MAATTIDDAPTRAESALDRALFVGVSERLIVAVILSTHT